MSLMADLLGTLFERRYRAGDGADAGRPLADLLRDLLGNRGEVSGQALARHVLDAYDRLDDAGKRTFFTLLAGSFDIDPEDIRTRLAAYEADPSGTTYGALMRAAEPSRQEVARKLNQIPGATAKLVAMRADLHRLSRGDADFARIAGPVDQDFRHLFRSWFNHGFLVLRPINWESPAHILDKIIGYEAVHAITSWDDLRQRLEPSDRRCFALFHPAMPDEPLIFVEVALTRGIPSSIADILAENRTPLPERDADTAVFYSISNCQQGLAGISFGNSLIKQVVALLSTALPDLATYVTLSPIPGFAGWLAESGVDPVPSDGEELRGLAAQYLLTARRADGRPRDAVARFHLGNGACVHDVHAGADLSPSGLAQSHGVMVNYLYDPARIARNHERFAGKGEITASAGVETLARNAGRKQRRDRPAG